MSLAFWVHGLLLISHGATDEEPQRNASSVSVSRLTEDSEDGTTVIATSRTTVKRRSTRRFDKLVPAFPHHLRNEDEDESDPVGQTISVIPSVLVKYETLIEKGAVVYSKPHVKNYTALLIDEAHHENMKPGIYVGALNWLIKFDFHLNETEAVFLNKKENGAAEALGNFIKKVYISDVKEDRVIVCGTNASNPGCSARLGTDLTVGLDYFKGLFPKEPNVSLAAYMWGNEVMIGTAYDSEGKEGKISLGTLRHGTRVLQTMDDEHWLLYAEFVGAFSISQTHKYVYVVFREVAMEAAIPNTVYSRVARICKDDSGGYKENTNYFTSFTKAFIHCGEFQHIRAISYEEDAAYLWATFTSDRINGSAICAFEMSNLESVFRGPYYVPPDDSDKDQEWKVCPPPYIFRGDTAVETCFGFRTVEAIKKYTYMSEGISSYCSPIFFPEFKIDKIAATTGKFSDITVFVSDEIGRIAKLSVDTCSPLYMQIWELKANKENSFNKINSVAIFRDSIIVLTDENVLKIPKKDYPGVAISPTPRSTSTQKSKTPDRSRDSRNGNTNQAHSISQPFEFPNKPLTLFMIIYLAILSSLAMK